LADYPLVSVTEELDRPRGPSVGSSVDDPPINIWKFDKPRRKSPSTGTSYSPGVRWPTTVSVQFTPEFVVLVTVVALVAGSVNGIAGFGFALVGTMALASAIDPATAVVFMIVPILAVNVSLLSDLSPSDLRTCGRRFGPLVVAALVGTVVGMAVLDWLPDAPLRVGLGVVTLGFVGTLQQRFVVPGLEWTKKRCFVESPAAMVGVGGVSGVVFGGTNVGVQLVAYLRSFDLSHGVFVGVVAMVFLGLNVLRVGAAGVLGLYPDATVFLASVAAAIPAVLGVVVGKRVRSGISAGTRRRVVVGLLLVVGVRLVLGGLGVA